MFDGNKSMRHVLTDEDIKKMTLTEGRFPFTRLPVCAHCEKLGLWSSDKITGEMIGICKSCGTITKNPHTYSDYLSRNYDVDETGKTFRSMLIADKKKDAMKRFFLPDYSKMGNKKDRFRIKLKGSEKIYNE